MHILIAKLRVDHIKRRRRATTVPLTNVEMPNAASCNLKVDIADMNKRRTLNNSIRRQSRIQAGFSLIELLVVIAIIGILVAVGYPSYTDYIIKSKRADGHLAVLSAVQAMERCKSTQFSYSTCTIPNQLTISPDRHYTIALNPAPTASTFTVVATPQAAQAGDTECATMSMNHLGNRTSTPGTADQDDNGCWM